MGQHHHIATALCHAATADHVAVAINIELPSDGSVPEWIELVPAGSVQGRDGRAWINDQAERVINRSLDTKRDIPIDWEHATEKLAPMGHQAPASAWIVSLEERDGAIWGKVDWTPKGRDSVANREYRYISPVFEFEKDTRRVFRLTSAALTNQPNLYLTALNRGEQCAPHTHNQEDAMLPEAILKALGLNKDATEEQVVTAINSMQSDLQTASNRAENPSLEKFVPRADYDAALDRAKNAEDKLAADAKSRLEGEIEREIEAATKAGKITPATVEYHKAQCRQEGGLERFREFVKSAPTVADPTGLDDTKTGGDKAKALNDEQRQVAALFGNSAEDIQKYALDA